jgi:ubiquinone biosynthesis protein
MLLFFKIKLYVLQFFRALQIVGILIRHAISDWMGRKKLLKRFVRKKTREGHIYHHNTQERIRLILEDLGPTYIKFGQILADRPDLVSEKLRGELKKLQTAARPMDDDEAIALIEEELQAKLEIIFAKFERKHIASASIGQVYKGTLHNGQRVAIKIQRPNIETKIKLDLYLLKYIAKKAVKTYPDLASLDLVGFVDEFNTTILKELDYFNEISNIIRFRELFKDDHTCYVPNVYVHYCTKKLIVMEYLKGVRPDNILQLKKEGFDLNKVAENGANILLKMILRHGFFHADPHPGNIFIMPGNRIGFIDYGMVGVLKPNHINFLANFVLGFHSNNPKTISDALLKLCGKKFFPESEDMEFEIQQLLNRYSYLPFNKIDMTQVLNDCIKIIIKYKLRIPSDIYLLLKALATLQKFAVQLASDFSLSEVLLPYAKDLIKIKFSPKKIVNNLFDVVQDYINLVRDFPGDVGQILYKIKEGKLIHEINLAEGSQFQKILRHFGYRVSLAVLVGLMLVCSSIMYVWLPNKEVVYYFFLGSICLTVWMILRLSIKSQT